MKLDGRSRLFTAPAIAAALSWVACSTGDVESPDGGTGPSADATTSSCPAPTGAGTMHQSPRASETWTAAGSPHIVDNALSILTGITVTIEACATVELADTVEIVVDGQLRALGEAGRPVTFKPKDPSKKWGQITATRTAVKPAIELRHAILEGGGNVQAADLEVAQMIFVRAAGGTTGQEMIFVEDVELRGSASSGISLLDAATFAAGSTGLRITGSASAPVVLNGFALTNLPDGSYRGNANDQILITTGERLGVSDVAATVVMHKRDVPYRVGIFGNIVTLTLGAPTGSAITSLQIEPGTTLLFKPGFVLFVASVNGASSGEIIAQGTAAEPITFSSAAATPAAGDWRGILFYAPPTAATVFDHVRFAFAGNQATETNGFSCGTPPSASPRDIVGALMFATDRPVTRQILTNSVIEDSGSNGVDRGWLGDPVDYLPTNQFTRIAYCTQTFPKPAVGLCPDPPPCPTE
ncbi:MAG: hypothetical protein IT384_11495 [Deltaproteobacteria bacterium]|nr:hypothetical protein [Deltaproteobacteria bacterium]